jgi:uncharacterized membrane protein YesL
MRWRDENSQFYDILDRVSTFVLANVLWVVLSIPVVTMPAATAGLFATMAPWARGKSPEVFRDFFSGLRQYWLKASLVGLVDALLGVWIVVNFRAFQLMDMSNPLALVSQSLTFFIALITILVNLYFWPMLVTFDMPLRSLVSTSAKLVFAHPLRSFGMLIVSLAPLVVSIFLPSAFWVLATFSTFALLNSKTAWRIMKRYIPEDERPDDTKPEQAETI